MDKTVGMPIIEGPPNPPLRVRFLDMGIAMRESDPGKII